MAVGPSILVVDNYDSFVYNIVQYLGELGASVTVLRNDVIDAHDVERMSPDGVLVSPGPGYPRDAGNSLAIIDYCAKSSLPMFGVCLGHQALGVVFGPRSTPHQNCCTAGRAWSLMTVRTSSMAWRIHLLRAATTHSLLTRTDYPTSWR
jgi:anthranilate synthase/aminodeoxychorismate synthase-like glutamine amidotransferase